MRITSSRIFTASAVLGLSQLPLTFAWGAAGHEIVATIAQIYLHPSTLQNICKIIDPALSESLSELSPPCYLSRVAAWADQIKRRPEYRYTAPLHYIGALDDHPSETCAFPGSRGWAGHRDMNVLGAIRNDTNILVDYAEGLYDSATAQDAVKFLIHYLGDMHMPLHLTGRERGGNGAKVTFDGRMTNLHSLWDGLLIAQRLRTLPHNYTRPFSRGATSIDVETHLRGAIYDPYVRRVMWEGMGVGRVPGRFEAEYQSWLTCPTPQTESGWESLQTILGFRTRGDETRWDDDVLCPFAWAKDLHKLNCDLVWPAELDQPPYGKPSKADASEDEESKHSHDGDFFARPRRPHPDLLELDTPEYAGRIRDEWVVEKLMVMAGVRLAGILNGLFMNVEVLDAQDCARFPLIPI